MRKFLQVVGIAALAILVAAPAFAIEFQMKGQYRVRYYSADGYGVEPANIGGLITASPFNKATNNQRTQTDYRFRPYFIVSDDKGALVSTVAFELGDTTAGSPTTAGFRGSKIGSASAGMMATDGIEAEVKNANIDFQIPFGVPARMRVGTGGFTTPKGMVMDDDAFGLKIYGKTGMVGYDLWWFKVLNAEQAGTICLATPLATTTSGATCPAGSVTAGPSNDDIDAWYARLDFAINPAINPYVYAMYRHGSVVESVTLGVPSAASSDGYWLGLGATGKVSNVAWDFDFVYGYDEPHLIAAGIYGTPGNGVNSVGAGGVGASMKRMGWMLDGGVEVPVGPVALGARFMYATGDKADTTGKSEDFPGFSYGLNNGTIASYTPKGAQIFWNAMGSQDWRGGFQATGYNTWGIGLYAKYYPVKSLMIQPTYWYAGAPSSTTNLYTGKGTIGHELNLQVEYTMYTGVTVYLMGGYLFTPSQGKQPVNCGPGITPGACVVTPGTNIDLKDVSVFSMGIYHRF